MLAVKVFIYIFAKCWKYQLLLIGEKIKCFLVLRNLSGIDAKMMAATQMLLFALSMCIVLSQRPPYAGKHPIGYPELEKPSTTSDDEVSYGGSTERLPLEARGDVELIKRLRMLPIDQQPFWLLNWQALELNRQNPQTYSIRPNPFLEDPKPHLN